MAGSSTGFAAMEGTNNSMSQANLLPQAAMGPGPESSDFEYSVESSISESALANQIESIGAETALHNTNAKLVKHAQKVAKISLKLGAAQSRIASLQIRKRAIRKILKK